MGCKFPEHHGGGGIDVGGKGGSWWPLGAAVIAAALFAPVIGAFIHVLSIVLTFTGMAAIAAGGGWVWWRVSHQQPRQIQAQHQAQVQAPRWGRPGLPQEQPQQLGSGPQLHLHLGDASPQAIAEALRQIRGGQ